MIVTPSEVLTGLHSDEVLVAQVLQGEGKAFDELVERYQNQAIRLAFSFLRHWEDAREVSQNAFLKAYFGLQRFRGEARFKTWFYRILMNQIKDAYRKRRHPEGTANESILATIASVEDSPQKRLEQEELRRFVEKAIEELPEKQKEVFLLRYFQEMNLADIGEALGIAEGTVKAHLAQAILKIRSQIGRFVSEAKEERTHG